MNTDTENAPRAPAGPDPAAGGALAGGEVERVGSRARRGVLVLVLRTVALQLATLGGTVVLARLLDPGDFGIFAIVQFALAFFTLFGDAGLGGALIQQKGTPSQRQLSSVSLVQVLLSLAVIGIVSSLAGPVVTLWKDLPPGSAWLLRVLSVSLLLTCLRVVPSILMERELLFGRLSIIEVAQTLAYFIAGCSLAALGYGIWALIAAVLVQGLVGAVGAFIARPWWPSLVIDGGELAPILRFGLAYQVKNIVGFLNGAVIPLYAGVRLGARSVGFIEWAMSTAYFPLRLVEIMARVAFPLFSRLQENPAIAARTLERTVQVCAVATLFMVGLFLGIGPAVVHVIFTDKWMPGLPLLYIFALAISIGFLSPLVGSALDAAGRPALFAWLAAGWTALNWIATPIGTHWGEVGFAAGYSVHVVVGNIVVIFFLLRLIPDTHIWPRVRVALLAATVEALVGRLWLSPRTGLGLVAAVLLLLFIFVGLVMLLDGRGFLDALRIVPGGDSKSTMEAT